MKIHKFEEEYFEKILLWMNFKENLIYKNSIISNLKRILW